MKKVTLGFKARTNLGLYSKSDPNLLRPYTDETFYGIDLAPYLKWEMKNWNLKAGVRFDYYYRDIIQEMNVSPVLDFGGSNLLDCFLLIKLT